MHKFEEKNDINSAILQENDSGLNLNLRDVISQKRNQKLRHNIYLLQSLSI